MAKRANAKTVEVNASHVAYMSHPKEAAKLIEEAASSRATSSQCGSTSPPGTWWPAKTDRSIRTRSA
jgi:hypothetical protein